MGAQYYPSMNSDIGSKDDPASLSINNMTFPPNQMTFPITNNNNNIQLTFPSPYCDTSNVRPNLGAITSNNFSNFYTVNNNSAISGNQTMYQQNDQRANSLQQEKARYMQQQRQKLKEFSTCNKKITVTADSMIQNIIGKVEKKKITPHLSPGQSPSTTPVPSLQSEDEFGDFVSFSSPSCKPKDSNHTRKESCSEKFNDINALMLKYSDFSATAFKKDSKEKKKEMKNGYQVASLEVLKQVTVPPSPLLQVHTPKQVQLSSAVTEQGYSSCLSQEWTTLTAPDPNSMNAMNQSIPRLDDSINFSSIANYAPSICKFGSTLPNHDIDKRQIPSISKIVIEEPKISNSEKPKFQFSPEHTIGSRLANYNVKSNQSELVFKNNEIKDTTCAPLAPFELVNSNIPITEIISSEKYVENTSVYNDEDEFCDFQSYIPSQCSGLAPEMLSNSSYTTPSSAPLNIEDKYSAFKEITDLLENTHFSTVRDSQEDIFYDASSNLGNGETLEEITQEDDFGDFVAVRSNDNHDVDKTLFASSLAQFDPGSDSLNSDSTLKISEMKLNSANSNDDETDVTSICSLDLKLPDEHWVSGSISINHPSSGVLSANYKNNYSLDKTEITTRGALIMDKYSAIRENKAKDADIHESEWLRCLKSCDKLLNTVISTLKQAEESVRKEAMTSSEGVKYLEYLDEIHLVVGRISQSSSNLGLRNASVQSILEKIDQCWVTLVEMLFYTEALFSDPPSSCNAQFTCDSTDDISHACGVCLLSVGLKNTVSYSGRQYHPSCANFWLNCVDSLLPALPKRELL